MCAMSAELSKSLNRVTIIGNLGRDPEMRFTPNGSPVICFCVATPRAWVDTSGVSHEEVEWFHVVAWGEMAEACRDRLSRSQSVYVEGRLHTRTWEDQHGRPCCRTELVASDVIPLDGQSDVVTGQGIGL